MKTSDIRATKIDAPDAWFLHAAPVSVLCVGATVDVETEVACLLTEPRVDVIVLDVEEVEVMPGVDVGVSVGAFIGDTLPIVGVVD
jgi:hypothetical protein